MTIKLKQKSVFGNCLTYPNCEKSLLLAKLLGVKTFNNYQINIIKELGYIIELETL